MSGPALLCLLLAAVQTGPRYVHLPPSAASVMTEHLRSIEANGWARTVPGDLYHAHLLLPPSAPEHFASLDEMFKYGVAVLYHSDEQLFRWRLEDGDLPVGERRPRSIVGYPDGTVVPAASLLAAPERSAPHYVWHGTVHPDDLARELPDRIAVRRDREVRFPRMSCTVNLIVDISPAHESGQIVTVNGKRLKLTMDCRPH